MTTPRYFVVGTDTEIGKTSVCVALLRAAQRAKRRWLPFKPAVSGDLSSTSDHARLARAVSSWPLDPQRISVHRYLPPVAPGLAETDHQFFRHPDKRDPNHAAISRAEFTLTQLHDEYQPDAVLIEGAGGLHVPMPGSTWLIDWIKAFAAKPIVVARAGLGTLNHTILTVEALRQLNADPIAFILNSPLPGDDDDSAVTNRRVLEARLNIPCLGIKPFDASAEDRDSEAALSWLVPNWLELLSTFTPSA